MPPDVCTAVLHVLPHPGGGGETYADALTLMDGYRFDRVFLASGPEAALDALRSGIGIPLRARHFDLVHVHGEVAAGICLPTLALRRSVVTLHGLNLFRRTTGAAHAAARVNLRLVVRAATATICVSNSERADVVQAVGRRSERRLAVIHNGVAAASPPTIADRKRAREVVGVGESEVVGLFVGSLEAHKDPLAAARAAAAVAAEGGALRLLVAGDGPLRGDVDRLEQATDGAVRALGFRTDIQTLLKASDFLVLPSLREGFSYAVLEAMASALPVVVSDAPGNVEAVGDAGIVVGRGDTDGFVVAFRRLLDAGTRRRLGERAHERVRRDFGVEEMVGRTREIYGRILAGRG